MADIYINVKTVTSLNDQVVETLICDNGEDYPIVIKKGSINKNVETIGIYSNLATGFNLTSLKICCLRICVLLKKDPAVVYADICDLRDVEWGSDNRINSAKVIIRLCVE